jgi:pyruvate/2-oxoglutarate dehydrogenase complex dihydrolipoamide acyltransferase (E2) component
VDQVEGSWRGETVAEKQSEALDKLNRGIQETKYAAQQQTIELAQGYFDDSTKTLKQQIKEDRATLKDLPDQIPGGREEVFQGMFQELMENFTAMEKFIDEAQKNVSNLDPEQLRRQGEVDATDAARRNARELGIDITEIEGTGSDGRVTVDDVKNFAEAAEGGVAGEEGELDASDAARREAEELGVDLSQVEGTGSEGRIIVSDVVEASKDAARREAEELGVDLSQVEGTGPGGLVTVKDVTSLGEESEDQATGQAGQVTEQVQGAAGQAAGQAQEAAGQATDQAGQAAGQAQQVAGQATDQAGQVAGQVQDAAGGVAQQAQDTAGQVTDQAGQAAQGVQDTVGGLTGGQQQGGQGGGGPLGGVTDQVGQAVQGVQDTAGQAAGQAQQAAGQATQQAQGAAGQVTEQATGEDEEEPKATNAARRRAEELGVDLSQVQGSGAGGLITIRDVTGG